MCEFELNQSECKSRHQTICDKSVINTSGFHSPFVVEFCQVDCLSSAWKGGGGWGATQ